MGWSRSTASHFDVAAGCYHTTNRNQFILEGARVPTFPTEAFDFEAGGLPKAAAWRLNFEPEPPLDEPYLAAVRLLVNTSHEEAAELLSCRPSPAHSVAIPQRR